MSCWRMRTSDPGPSPLDPTSFRKGVQLSMRLRQLLKGGLARHTLRAVGRTARLVPFVHVRPEGLEPPTDRKCLGPYPCPGFPQG